MVGQIIREMPLSNVTVLFDAYYLCPNVTSACEAKKYRYVGVAKKNRNFFPDGRDRDKRKLATYGANVLNRSGRWMTQAGKKFRLAERVGRLSKLGYVKLVFSRRFLGVFRCPWQRRPFELIGRLSLRVASIAVIPGKSILVKKFLDKQCRFSASTVALGDPGRTPKPRHVKDFLKNVVSNRMAVAYPPLASSRCESIKGTPMKRTVLVGLSFLVLASVDVKAYASIITFIPGDEIATSNDNSELDASDVLSLTGAMGPISLLYKAEVGIPVIEEGPFAPFYTTEFFNTATDPEDATISWDGPTFIADPRFLVVKDGNQSPAQYIFDLSSWDGMMDIQLEDFWPDQGAISHVSIWGGEAGGEIPEPAAVVVWSGLLLIGLAYTRRKWKTCDSRE